ncbi:hypothetical protein MTO96_033983, partial [Rhipicephalus appendiculatus]
VQALGETDTHARRILLWKQKGGKSLTWQQGRIAVPRNRKVRKELAVEIDDSQERLQLLPVFRGWRLEESIKRIRRCRGALSADSVTEIAKFLLEKRTFLLDADASFKKTL